MRRTMMKFLLAWIVLTAAQSALVLQAGTTGPVAAIASSTLTA